MKNPIHHRRRLGMQTLVLPHVPEGQDGGRVTEKTQPTPLNSPSVFSLNQCPIRPSFSTQQAVRPGPYSKPPSSSHFQNPGSLPWKIAVWPVTCGVMGLQSCRVTQTFSPARVGPNGLIIV